MKTKSLSRQLKFLHCAESKKLSFPCWLNCCAGQAGLCEFTLTGEQSVKWLSSTSSLSNFSFSFSLSLSVSQSLSRVNRRKRRACSPVPTKLRRPTLTRPWRVLAQQQQQRCCCCPRPPKLLPPIRNGRSRSRSRSKSRGGKCCLCVYN